MADKRFGYYFLLMTPIFLLPSSAGAQVSVKDYERAAIEAVRQKQAAAKKAEADRAAAAARVEAQRRDAVSKKQAEQRATAGRAQAERLAAERKATAERKVVSDRLASLRSAADSGDADAARQLYLTYIDEDSGTYDIVQAMQWLHKSATLGLQVSKKDLALRYRDGNGLLKDNDKFITIIQEVAENGDGEAAYILAKNFEPIRTSSVNAQIWMSRAADLGWLPAQIDRSIFLIRNFGQNSNGIIISDEEKNKILPYLTNGTKAGIPRAFLGYGMLYEKGIFFQKDNLKATSYYKKALFGGELTANGFLWGVDPFGYFGRNYSPEKNEYNINNPDLFNISCRIQFTSLNSRQYDNRHEAKLDSNDDTYYFEAKSSFIDGKIWIDGDWWSIQKDDDYNVYKTVGGTPRNYEPNQEPYPYIIDFDNKIVVERIFRSSEKHTYGLGNRFYMVHKCDE